MAGMKKQPVMLVVSDAVSATGFARVVRGMLDPLAGKYDIHQLGLGYNGDPHDWPWRLYPAQAGGDAFGVGRIAELFDRVKPDLVLFVSNLGRVRSYLQALGERAAATRVVVYSALEAGPVPGDLVAPLCRVSRLVFYTEYARREYESAAARQTDGSMTGPLPRADVIPHGIDPAVFCPFAPEGCNPAEAKRRAKEQLFRGHREHVESFIVLNGNRNDRRKRIDLTIRGFAEFARGKDRFVKLHLHMGTPDVGWDVIELSRRFGVYERLVLTNRARHLPNVSAQEMNLIYNAADVGLNTASSEGWGLVSFEHAATRAAQIVPRHANLAELWDGAAEMVEPAFTLNDPEIRADQHLVAPEGVAAALERLYADEARRHEVAQRCFAHATRPCFRWDQISAQWERLFEELL